MPNYQGVWDITTQFQYAAEWQIAALPAAAAGSVFFFGGTANANGIQFIENISSTGNATDYGDLRFDMGFSVGVGNTTLGLTMGTNQSGYQNKIEKFILKTGGSASNFGDLLGNQYQMGSTGSATRGIAAGGAGSSNVIQYVTFASEGNATDFGDLTVGRLDPNGGQVNSTTRGVFMGGNSGSVNDTIDYITIGSTGNASDFGNLVAATAGTAGCCSATRGVSMGGAPAGTAGANTIEYITIDSTGNTTDFGDLSTTWYLGAGGSNKTRGVIAGGRANGNSDVIEYITIASTGDSADFGDLTVGSKMMGSASNLHGGIA